MKSLNLKVAIILIVLGTVLMVVSANPVNNGCGMLNAEACYVLSMEGTKTWFILFSTPGILSIAGALLIAFLGRKKDDNVIGPTLKVDNNPPINRPD